MTDKVVREVEEEGVSRDFFKQLTIRSQLQFPRGRFPKGSEALLLFFFFLFLFLLFAVLVNERWEIK